MQAGHAREKPAAVFLVAENVRKISSVCAKPEAAASAGGAAGVETA